MPSSHPPEDKDSDYARAMELIKGGSEISGSAAGATIGFLGGGAPGAIIGAAAGPLISRVLIKVGAEIQKRILGPREFVRVGAVAGFAGAEIKQLLEAGHPIRNDGFFDPDITNRSKADEILEGVLLKARDSYEEKKLPYLGRLYAQIAFNQGFSQHYANILIKYAGQLSYTQYVALSVAAENPNANVQLRDQPYSNTSGPITLSSDVVGLLSEIYDLGQNDLITDGSVWMGLSHITPSKMRPEGVGDKLVSAMGLQTIPQVDKAVFYTALV